MSEVAEGIVYGACRDRVSAMVADLGDEPGQPPIPGYGLQELTPGGSWKTLNGNQAATLAVDDQGDVTAEFQGAGVAEFPATGSPRLLTAADAKKLAMDGSGDVFALFPGYGVWKYDPAKGWIQLTATDALLIAAS